MSSDVQQAESRLRITEIFYSLQGESSYVGMPTVFIRLTGCPLRCGYCDTEYAFSGGDWMPLDEILQQVKQYQVEYICVTGGEPLAQKSCGNLLTALCDEGYKVSIETSGAMDVCSVDERVKRIMDIKTPGSGEESKNKYTNIDCLNSNDEIKFVICNREDYDWAKAMLEKHGLVDKCQVLMSPEHVGVKPGELADWIIGDQLKVRFQFQLHKYLWNNEPGR